MPRARNIKPSFFRNPDLAELEPIERLLFIGLWTMADREGRLEDRPRYIKFELLPSDQFDIDVALNALQNRGFILRYEHGDGRFIQVVNFVKHQNPHVKEAPSTIPAPDKHGASMVQDTTQNAASTPSYLDPDPVVGSSSGNLDPDPPPKPPTPIRPVPAAPDRPGKPDPSFDAFWEAWPKKEGKQAAIAAWRKLRLTPDAVQDVLDAIPRQQAAKDWPRENWRYCPNPATWLNQRRWEDEVPEPVPERRELIGKDKERADVMRRVLEKRGYEFTGPQPTAHANGRPLSDQPLRVGDGRVPR